MSAFIAMGPLKFKSSYVFGMFRQSNISSMVPEYSSVISLETLNSFCGMEEVCNNKKMFVACYISNATIVKTNKRDRNTISIFHSPHIHKWIYIYIYRNIRIYLWISIYIICIYIIYMALYMHSCVTTNNFHSLTSCNKYCHEKCYMPRQ